MSESFLNGRIKMIPGDCLDVLATLAENSIDSCVTDPPYHLTNNTGSRSPLPGQYTPIGRPKEPRGGFMGKQWDGGDIAFDSATWAAVLRVLKPGAYIVAFSSSRTYHRMACAIEDAGFITHPLVAWITGQGFPKAHSVSKHLDRIAGAEREVLGQYIAPDGNPRGIDRGIQGGSFAAGQSDYASEKLMTTPATDAAKQWDGWYYGTQSLKPAIEPIYVGQKPFEKGLNGTQNILKWGCGALNINGCRVASDGDVKPRGSSKLDTDMHEGWARPWMENRAEVQKRHDNAIDRANTIGRWPTNVILSDDAEVLATFPETGISSGGGGLKVGVGVPNTKAIGHYYDGNVGFGDSGSAARFFYCARPNETEQVVITWISESEPCQATLLVDTGQLPGRGIVVLGSTTNPEWSTFLSGNKLTDLFRAASTFTIKTGTNSTTESRTWNYLISLLTSASMVDVKYETVNGGNHAANAETGIQSLIIMLAKTVSLPGANHAASGTRLKINVSAVPAEQLNSIKQFHYGSKADGDDRIGAFHPTVKPLDLMQYLVRLVTPPKGLTLDPFAGTGTTGEAAFREAFNAILIEREAEYQADIRRRMKLIMSGPDERARESIKQRMKNKPIDHGPLFEGAE